MKCEHSQQGAFGGISSFKNKSFSCLSYIAFFALDQYDKLVEQVQDYKISCINYDGSVMANN